MCVCLCKILFPKTQARILAPFGGAGCMAWELGVRPGPCCELLGLDYQSFGLVGSRVFGGYLDPKDPIPFSGLTEGNHNKEP